LILAKWILNNRGLLVYEQPKIPLIENSQQFVLEIKAKSEEYLENEIFVWKSEEYQNYQCIAKIYDNDIYVIWFSQVNLKNIEKYVKNNPEIETEFDILIELRSGVKSYFKQGGLLFIDFIDHIGPEIKFNTTSIKEEDALRIGMHFFSTIGLGKGKYQGLNSMQGPFYLKSFKLIALIYGFLRPAPKSTDPRIAKIGRPSIFIIVFSSNNESYMPSTQLITTFIETLMQRSELNSYTDFPNSVLQELKTSIEEYVLFAIDVNQMEQIRVIRLQEEVTQLKKENERLKLRIQKLERGKRFFFWKKRKK
jgi:hypothetical protein